MPLLFQIGWELGAAKSHRARSGQVENRHTWLLSDLVALKAARQNMRRERDEPRTVAAPRQRRWEERLDAGLAAALVSSHFLPAFLVLSDRRVGQSRAVVGTVALGLSARSDRSNGHRAAGLSNCATPSLSGHPPSKWVSPAHIPSLELDLPGPWALTPRSLAACGGLLYTPCDHLLAAHPLYHSLHVTQNAPYACSSPCAYREGALTS